MCSLTGELQYILYVTGHLLCNAPPNRTLLHTGLGPHRVTSPIQDAVAWVGRTVFVYHIHLPEELTHSSLRLRQQKLLLMQKRPL